MRNGIDWHAYERMTEQLSTNAEVVESELLAGDAIKPAVLALYDSGYRRGHSTGWPALDEFFTVRSGEMTVITGIPGHGKSSWLDNLMINLSSGKDWRWAVFSAENYPIARHVASLLEVRTGLPFNRGPSTRMTPAERDEALDWVCQHFRFIKPQQDRYSLDRIIQIAFSIGDIEGLVIDPWNELDSSRPKEMREDEFISVSLTKLRWLARNAEIKIFVVAHPAKYQRQQGQPKPVITLNDVKGASEWYAKADNGISVWRDETDTSGATDVYVQKVRFREVGRAGGMIKLYYDRVSGRFTDPTASSRYSRVPGEDDE
jgi:twinkle protein